MRRIAVSSGAQRSLAALARKGLVQLAGLTPSDAAHVLGLQDNWSRPAAVAAARLATRGRGLGPPTGDAAEALCREIWSETVRLSARALLEVAIGAAGRPLAGAALLIDAASRGQRRVWACRRRAQAGPAGGGGGRPGQGLSSGSGAPARLRDRLSGALGGGQCSRRRQRRGGAQRHHCVTGDGAGAFRVHLPDGVSGDERRRGCADPGRNGGAAVASEAALAMGATMVEVSVKRDFKLLPDAVDDNGLFDGPDHRRGHRAPALVRAAWVKAYIRRPGRGHAACCRPARASGRSRRRDRRG